MNTQKLNMDTIGRENGENRIECSKIDDDSYCRSKISNVLVFYVNGIEVRIIICITVYEVRKIFIIIIRY